MCACARALTERDGWLKVALDSLLFFFCYFTLSTQYLHPKGLSPRVHLSSATKDNAHLNSAYIQTHIYTQIDSIDTPWGDVNRQKGF